MTLLHIGGIDNAIKFQPCHKNDTLKIIYYFQNIKSILAILSLKFF